MSEPTINGILRHLIGQRDLLESVCRNYETHRTEFARGQIAELNGTIALVEALRNRVMEDIKEQQYCCDEYWSQKGFPPRRVVAAGVLRALLGAQEVSDE